MTRPRPADPPDRAARPVPLVAVPEGTSEPSAWSTESTAPLTPPVGEDDEILAERQQAEHAEREARSTGSVTEPAQGIDPESGYSTEESQGAALPGPRERRDP
jgi:hypothetical protein